MDAQNISGITVDIRLQRRDLRFLVRDIRLLCRDLCIDGVEPALLRRPAGFRRFKRIRLNDNTLLYL